MALHESQILSCLMFTMRNCIKASYNHRSTVVERIQDAVHLQISAGCRASANLLLYPIAGIAKTCWVLEQDKQNKMPNGMS